AGVVAVLLTGFATIIFLSVIYVLYRLFRRGVALLLKGVDLQVPPIALLVSFALAATIFTTGAINLWSILYGLMQVLFTDLPRAIVEIAYMSYACGKSISQTTRPSNSSLDLGCLLRTGGTMANSVQLLFSRSLTYLTRVISLV